MLRNPSHGPIIRWSSSSIPRIFFCHENVTCARGEGPRRVIVHEYDRRRTIRYCICEDFAGMNLALVDQSPGDQPDVQDLMRSGKGCRNYIFLLIVAVLADKRQNVFDALDFCVLSVRRRKPGASSRAARIWQAFAGPIPSTASTSCMDVA